MASQTKNYVQWRAKAATWLLKNKDRAAWWDWPVLTSSNPDSTAPGVPDVLAFDIFTDLVERKLLVTHTIESADGDKKRGVYKLNLGNENAWKEVTNPAGCYRRSLIWLAKNIAWLFAVAVSALIAGLVTWFLKEVIRP